MEQPDAQEGHTVPGLSQLLMGQVPSGMTLYNIEIRL